MPEIVLSPEEEARLKELQTRQEVAEKELSEIGQEIRSIFGPYLENPTWEKYETAAQLLFPCHMRLEYGRRGMGLWRQDNHG